MIVLINAIVNNEGIKTGLREPHHPFRYEEVKNPELFNVYKIIII